MPWVQYLAAVPAEPAASPMLPGALAGPFPPGPAAAAGVSAAGVEGSGWIPSSSVLQWPGGKNGWMEAWKWLIPTASFLLYIGVHGALVVHSTVEHSTGSPTSGMTAVMTWPQQ